MLSVRPNATITLSLLCNLSVTFVGEIDDFHLFFTGEPSTELLNVLLLQDFLLGVINMDNDFI